MIEENDDSCIVNVSGKSKFKKFIYFTPMIIFGIILAYQLFKISNNKNITNNLVESNLKD